MSTTKATSTTMTTNTTMTDVDEVETHHELSTCISCNEVIHTREPMIRSRHGNYHAPPKNCVEGRD